MATATLTFTDTAKGNLIFDVDVASDTGGNSDDMFELTPAMLHAVAVKTLYHMGWLAAAGAATLESIEDGSDLYQRIQEKINEKE